MSLSISHAETEETISNNSASNQQKFKFDYSSYAKKMRISLSGNNIRKQSGELNHTYFNVKKNQYFCKEKLKSLYRGLEIFGVGEWKDIKYYEFDSVDKDNKIKTTEVELELRTCILFGISNLEEYIGNRYTKSDIQEIQKENIAKAQKNGKLKYGIYQVE